jgi:hypothetical protein
LPRGHAGFCELERCEYRERGGRCIAPKGHADVHVLAQDAVSQAVGRYSNPPPVPLKASELVLALLKAIDEHGDLAVVVFETSYGGQLENVRGVKKAHDREALELVTAG